MAQSTEEAYLEQHTQAAHLIQQLGEAIFDLPAPDGDVAIDWGHVGSVAELNRQLSAALAFIQGDPGREN
jgi:hypothetical protein